MGSNPASNHPVAFKWIQKAIDNGAKLICVDPRFTQTAAKAAHLCPPALRHRHRLPGRHDQVHPRQQPLFRGVCQGLHQCQFPGQPGLQNARRQRRRIFGPDRHENQGRFCKRHLRQDGLVIPDERRRHRKKRSGHAGSQLRAPASEKALQPVYTRNRRTDHGNAQGQTPGRYTRHTARPANPTRQAPNCMPWAGPSIPSAYRTSGPWPSSSCCWATWALPAAA